MGHRFKLAATRSSATLASEKGAPCPQSWSHEPTGHADDAAAPVSKPLGCGCKFQPPTERLLYERSEATLPHSGVLGVQGLRLGNGRTVGEGDRVLVVGASGNVGPFAVQIAKSRGAHVTIIDSSEVMTSSS